MPNILLRGRLLRHLALLVPPARLPSLFDIVFLRRPVATGILGGLGLDPVPISMISAPIHISEWNR
jgi:hypothetical protein